MRDTNGHKGAAPEARLITVAGVADRLASVTGKPASFHARQLRGFIHSNALVPRAYAGEGRTAAAVFDETAICRAMILYTLASLGLDFSFLEITNRVTLELTSRITRNLDPKARISNTVEPTDAVEFAIERIRAGQHFYLYLGFPTEPLGDALGGLMGWVTPDRRIPDNENSPVKYRAHIVLPLHTILRPLLT
jgi:hypothetical protein